MLQFQSIDVTVSGSVLHLKLNRPAQRNALSPLMITELTELFRGQACQPETRIVVLSGNGGFFCSGADLNWMKDSSGFTEEENLADALRLYDLFDSIQACPAYVVAQVEGGAFGGGIGLLSCCDAVLCAGDCQFSLSEVRLGLSPATIAPHVVQKIGMSNSRRLMLSARRFNAAEARQYGLVSEIAEAADLPSLVEDEISLVLACAPQALAATKRLLQRIGSAEPGELRQITSLLIAELRRAAEGQEGLRAFLEKRRPSWNLES